MINLIRAKVFWVAVVISLLISSNQGQGGTIGLAWKASPDARTVGYLVFYGTQSGVYGWVVDAGRHTTLSVTGLTPGTTYYLVTEAYSADGKESVFSNEVTNRVPAPPQISTQPSAETVVAGGQAAFSVGASGDAPLSFQWMDGTTPVAAGRGSLLNMLNVGLASAGNYTVIVSNSWGSITSSVATLTVLPMPASIVMQPQSQIVVATTPAAFTSAETGTPPLAIQWYSGATPIAGATGSTLAWTSALATNAGNYYFTVSNIAGMTTSAVVSLVVLPTNAIAGAQGSYNGLFFPTNANGTPAISEATSGYLGSASVGPSGVFSARLNNAGLVYMGSGGFDISGNANVTFTLGGSNLVAALHLDLIHGTRQMTGTISSTNVGNVWTASLVADLATNAFPNLTGASFVAVPALSLGSLASLLGTGAASGSISSGVLTLSGTLGDLTSFNDSAPISKDGNIPVYKSLYNKGNGLLEGWINVTGGVVTGNLTWVRPIGILVPLGFPQGFNATLQVSGLTIGQ